VTWRLFRPQTTLQGTRLIRSGSTLVTMQLLTFMKMATQNQRRCLFQSTITDVDYWSHKVVTGNKSAKTNAIVHDCLSIIATQPSNHSWRKTEIAPWWHPGWGTTRALWKALYLQDAWWRMDIGGQSSCSLIRCIVIIYRVFQKKCPCKTDGE
jgi:hypothetical protein